MKKHLHILLALVLAIGSTVASAQQDPQYTMYMWNMMAVNPAYAGSNELLSITALARQQWSGLDGAPSTQSLVIQSPLKNDKLGLGLSVVNDKVGPVNTTLIYGDFAYRIRTGQNTRLAFGLKAGINLFQAKVGELANVNASDPVFQQNVSGKPAPNFGFGLYYWGKKGYLGLSAPKLMENSYGTVVTSAGETEVLAEKRHFFLVGGYVFTLSDAVKLRPSFLVKAVDGAPISIDLSALFVIHDRFWIGGAYRNQSSCSAIAAFQVTDQVKVGYAYDFTTTELRGYQSGSHELMLTYDLRFNKNKILSPRYF